MKKDLSLKKIGFISKLNGFNGELVIAGTSEDFLTEKFLFMFMDGMPVPFSVEEMFDKGGNVIVKLEDVNDEDSARRFIKLEVFIVQKKRKPKSEINSIHDLLNYHLIDSTFGDLGPIIRIDEFPQQEIAVCIVKEKEVLIPINNDFIDDIDDENRQILVTLPDGLIDLYLL
ncbi:MAG: ribosome maturation factor RimM [Bacteroidetes bacterium]|nr:ribosome maturation factor RimM [Bacteroidota bacterium]